MQLEIQKKKKYVIREQIQFIFSLKISSQFNSTSPNKMSLCLRILFIITWNTFNSPFATGCYCHTFMQHTVMENRNAQKYLVCEVMLAGVKFILCSSNKLALNLVFLNPPRYVDISHRIAIFSKGNLFKKAGQNLPPNLTT